MAPETSQQLSPPSVVEILNFCVWKERVYGPDGSRQGEAAAIFRIAFFVAIAGMAHASGGRRSRRLRPVGLNLYVIDPVVPGVPLATVLRGAHPFMLCMVAGIIPLCLFPEIAVWLPEAVMGKAN
jgi:hypothetical protein